MSLARLDLFSQKLINPHKSNYFPAGYVPLSCPLMSQASTAFHHWHAWSMRTLLEMALPLEHEMNELLLLLDCPVSGPQS